MYLFNMRNARRAVRNAGLVPLEVSTLAAVRYISLMSSLLRKRRLSRERMAERNSLKEEVQGLIFQMWERSLVLFRPQAGEYILVVARKPSSSETAKGYAQTGGREKIAP